MGVPPITARVVALIMATGCVIGCGAADAPIVSLGDVVGRHLQPPWWEAMPQLPPTSTPHEHDDPPSVTETESRIEFPVEGLVIPGDTLFDIGPALSGAICFAITRYLLARRAVRQRLGLR
jgi:hypothetical protein